MAFSGDFNQDMSQNIPMRQTHKISDLNSAILQEEKFIADTCYKIGVEYVYKNKESINGPFTEMVAAIKAAEQRISQYRQLIDQAQQTVKCKCCGADIPGNLAYCNCCGAPLQQNQEPAPTEENTIECYVCGQIIPTNTNFCTGCGKPVAEIIKHYKADSAENSEPDTNSIPESNPVQSAEPQDSFDSSADMYIDNNQNSYSEVPADTKSDPIPEMPVQNIRATCPGCGSFVSDEMIFCTGCGTKLK